MFNRRRTITAAIATLGLALAPLAVMASPASASPGCAENLPIHGRGGWACAWADRYDVSGVAAWAVVAIADPKTDGYCVYAWETEAYTKNVLSLMAVACSNDVVWGSSTQPGSGVLITRGRAGSRWFDELLPVGF